MVMGKPQDDGHEPSKARRAGVCVRPPKRGIRVQPDVRTPPHVQVCLRWKTNGGNSTRINHYIWEEGGD